MANTIKTPSLWASLSDFPQLPFTLSSIFSVPLAIFLIAFVVFPILVVTGVISGLVAIAIAAIFNIEKAKRFFSTVNKTLFNAATQFAIQFSEKLFSAIFFALTFLPALVIARLTRKYRPQDYIHSLVTRLVDISDPNSQQKMMRAVLEKYDHNHSTLALYLNASKESKELRSLLSERELKVSWPMFCHYMAESDKHNGKRLFNVALSVIDKAALPDVCTDELEVNNMRQKLKELYSIIHAPFWGRLGKSLFSPIVPTGVQAARRAFLKYNIDAQDKVMDLKPHQLFELALSMQTIAHQRLAVANGDRRNTTEYTYLQMKEIKTLMSFESFNGNIKHFWADQRLMP